ncbi:MAG: hypothetical protein L0241_19305 [Planctomycetia bacterium]|nr:hypothetical protein [Planctomycetia bacterium]
MIVSSSLSSVVLMCAVGPLVAKNTQPLPFNQLPTPEELNAEVSERVLKGFRKLLAATEELRKSYERRTDGDYSKRIAELREQEADIKRQIEFWEKVQGAPSGPSMPLLNKRQIKELEQKGAEPPKKPKIWD